MFLVPRRVPDASKKLPRTALRPSWKRLGPSRKLFGASGGRLGGVLKLFDGGCWTCWKHIRAILGRLGASLERPEPDFLAKMKPH